MKKRILLINPKENDPRRTTDMYPSGSLLLLGTLLTNKGYPVKIIHMLSDKITNYKLKEIINDFKPDYVGITMNTYQTKSVKQITKLIKKINKYIIIVVGGPHPSALKLAIFKDFPNIDIAVVGEGEKTFMEIVAGRKLGIIKGICYKNKTNPPRPLISNLDFLPYPNLDLININKFTGADPVGAKPTMYIMASRGCPFNCIFCNKSVWGKTVRFRKPSHILKEIKWLYYKYNIKEIFFQDDAFNLNRIWAEKVFNLIIKSGLHKKILFKTPFRANRNLVDIKLLKLAKKAGFWLIFYGVENGSQQMLDRMKKGLTVAEIKRAFKLTHMAGIKTFASFIIGLPGETNKTVEATYKLWKELKPYRAGYAFAIPFPKTEFAGIASKEGNILCNNYDFYHADSVVVRTNELTKKDIIRLRNNVFDRIYLNPVKRGIKQLKYIIKNNL